MIVRSITISLVVLLAAVQVSRAGERQVCPARAVDCEQQIRQMLEGKRYLGAKLQETKNGVIVANVVSGSPADRAGLAVGDRIVIVNGKDCTKARVRAIKEILNSGKDKHRALFIVIRNGSLKTIRARLDVMSKEQIDKVIAAHLREAHALGGER